MQDMKVTEGPLRVDISAPVASSFPAQTEKAHLDVPYLILPYWCMHVTDRGFLPLRAGQHASWQLRPVLDAGCPLAVPGHRVG